MSKAKTQVFLNVYDLSPENSYLYSIGFGAYHSGLEINGVEYTFGSGGVFSHAPKEAEMDGQCKFRERILLGETQLSSSKIEEQLAHITQQFPGNSYDVVHKNCNHFTEAFSRSIFNKSVQPGWVNRSANYGKKLSWIFGKKQQEEVTIKKQWQPFQGSGNTLSSDASNQKEIKKSWFGGNKEIKNEVIENQKSETISRDQMLAIHEARLKRLQNGNKPEEK